PTPLPPTAPLPTPLSPTTVPFPPPGPVAIPTPGPAPSPAPGQPNPLNAHTVLVAPRAPAVNVAGPITNTPGHGKPGRFFHREKERPKTPPRPPLIERLRGNP